ncbi:MAG: SDR family oxidoreductase [Treponema sp.]|nr:SDR family oxidoreductase [Treponema sp.]
MPKRLLITGANKANGIGIETLRLFLDAGFEAVVIARNFDDFEFKDNPNVKAIQYDLSDLSGIKELVKKIGHIDVLINNSGINNFTNYRDYPEELSDRILRVNFLAPLELIKAVVADWEKNGFGRIVNVSSIAAEHGNRDVFYGATKAALTNLAKSLYLLDGDKGLIVNTVHPGVVTSNWYPENPVRKTIVEEAKKANQLISPVEVAKTIFWLGTSSPSSINGEVIRVAS